MNVNWNNGKQSFLGLTKGNIILFDCLCAETFTH